MKIIKIKLKEIKVESFITKMSTLQLKTAKGGITGQSNEPTCRFLYKTLDSIPTWPSN